MSKHMSIMLSNNFSQGVPNQSVTEKLFRWVERDLDRVRRGLESLNPGPGPLQALTQHWGGVNLQAAAAPFALSVARSLPKMRP
jgi:hypothetical protein